MPFGRDTRAVPSNIMLDRGPICPTRQGRFGGLNPSFSDAVYCQITLALVMHLLLITIIQYNWAAGHIPLVGSLAWLCVFVSWSCRKKTVRRTCIAWAYTCKSTDNERKQYTNSISNNRSLVLSGARSSKNGQKGPNFTPPPFIRRSLLK